jgi:outer membrane protein assembly factor BamB
VFTVPSGPEHVLTGEMLYVLAGRPAPGQPGGNATLTAYRLADGSRQWLARYRPAAGPSLYVHAGVLLAYTPSGTVALDPRTGLARWDSRDAPAGEAGGRVLLSSLGDRSLEPDGPTDAEQDLTGVEPLTGRPGWRLRIRGQVDHDSGRLATLDLGGQLTSFDLTTGRLVARTTVRLPYRQATIRIAGPVLVLRSLGLSVLVGYDLDTLAERWTAYLPGDGAPHDCGPVLCWVYGDHLYAIDPATGDPAWPPMPLPPYRWRTPLADRDHLILSGSGQRDPTRERITVVIDLRAGREVLRLPGWEAPVPTPPPDPAGRLLVRHTPPTTWLGRLHPDLARLDPVAATDGLRPSSCSFNRDHAVCRDLRQFHVWRIRG